LTIAKLNKTNGRDNKNLPPAANNMANIIDIIKIENLATRESFFDETLVINFKNK
jgi:hypothetical protein